MRERLALLGACVLAVALAMPALLARVDAERRTTTVDLAVVDSSLYDWTQQARGSDADAVAERLTAAGIPTVVLGMRSIRQYLDTGEVEVVDAPLPSDADADADTDTLPARLASSGRAMVLRGRPGDPGGVFGRIVRVLRARYGSEVVTASAGTPDGSVRFVRVGDIEDLADVPLGYDPARLRAVQRTGFRVVLALPARVPAGRGWLETEITRAARATGAKTVLATGPLPFMTRPGQRTAFADFLDRAGYELALPDLGLVAGGRDYGTGLPGRLVRTHVIAMGPSDDPHVLEVRARRAQKERGVRLIVLRPPAEDPDATLDLGQVEGLAGRISGSVPAPFRTGAAAPMPAVEPGWPVVAGSVAAALVVLVAAGWWLIGRRTALAAGAVGVALGGAALAGWLTALQGLQLGTAVAGATLAVVAAMPALPAIPAREGVGLPGLLRSYALAGVVAVTTGLAVASLGSRSLFLAGLEPFQGVKVLLLAPPLLVAGYAVTRLRMPVIRIAGALRPVHVVVGVLVLAAGAYYLVRSGNSGIAPDLELRVRDALDEALYVRPRFKEAFLGFPALVLAIGWPAVVSSGSWRRVRWGWAVLGSVGTASVVDTFSHFHSPLFASLLRTAYGLGIGLACGLCAWGLLRIVRTRRARPTEAAP